MAVRVEPARPRATISEEPDGLRVVIPARRSWPAVGFLFVWLCGWAVGWIAVPIATLLNPGPIIAFMLIWWVFWTIGGGFAMYALLWQLRGFEIISARSDALITRKEVFGRGRAHQFDMAHVRDLRASAGSVGPWDWGASMQWWGMGGGPIAFDYGAKTYRVGSPLDEAEAKQIVARVKERVRLPG